LARKASIEKNNKKKATAKKYFAHRNELRAKAVDMKLTEEERNEARKNLQAVGEQDVSSQGVLVGIIESLDYPE
jgi:hypothetical protein